MQASIVAHTLSATFNATLIFNADILCMDEARTTAEAIVFDKGIVRFVGSEPAARAWLKQSGVNAFEQNAEGACILPGFIDAHLHPMLMSVYEHSIDCSGVASLLELERRVALRVASLGDADWVLGLQLDEQLLETKKLPTRGTLDEMCPDKPLVIFKRDGHSIAVNSLALRLAGLEQGASVVEGGTVELDSEGQPTGIFRENAVALVMQHFVPPSQDQLLASAVSAFAKLSRQGVTSIGAILQTDVEGPGGASSQHEMLAMQALAESSPFAIYSILIGRRVPDAQTLIGSPLNSPDLGHKTQAFKIFADGTLGSCTACMHEGFFDQPEKKGYLTLPGEEIYQRMVEAHKQNWQICIHAIGDKAIDTCVGLYERLLDAFPRDNHRHRIEHASIVNPAVVKRIAELKLVLCCQPLFIRSERHWLLQRLGSDRAGMAYPFKSFFDSGIVIAGSSDAPIESVNVLAAIECCVTRDGFSEGECLSVDQALAMYTCNGAFVQFEEQEKGSLVSGKRADMVILDKNPHQVAPGSIGKISVLQTICAGKTSYSKRAESQRD